jgi:3-hydroxy-9,10-secoandrosta-1,3,5(10)-triene-9,17-dione monooxygenase reductase component
MRRPAADRGEPATEEFRHALRRFPTGVVAITAHDGEPVGLAIGSFVSISLEPPLVGFFFDNASTTGPRIEEAGRFAVNVLGEQHAALCQRFAVTGVDRFAGVAWTSGVVDAPLLDDALAWIECDIADVIQAGDHRLVVGHVRRVDIGQEARPLVFFGGELAALATAAA